VVAGYYVSSVKFLGGYPLTVRGTQNVCVRDFQTWLLGGNVRHGRPVYMSRFRPYMRTWCHKMNLIIHWQITSKSAKPNTHKE